MSKKERTIDPSKGYRIHLDTLHHSELLPSFAQAHAGTPLQDSRWYLDDPDLKDRESHVVKTLDDLLTLMQTGDHNRIANSVVLFGSNSKIDWKEFFVREGRKGDMERFADLYNRVGKVKGGDPIPCAMVFEAAETKTLRHFGEQWIKGKGIYVDGKNIDFELSLRYLKEHNWADVTIQKGQLILVTGLAERSYSSRFHETVRVYVDNEKSMRWVTRKELTTPPPPAEPVPPRSLTYEELGPLD